LVEFLLYYYPEENTEIGYAKNWKGHIFSRLTKGDANDNSSHWHSCIFGSFWRNSSTHLDPAKSNCAATKGKRL